MDKLRIDHARAAIDALRVRYGKGKTKLTDDCGPCYACAKLAELMAENNALRGIVGDLKAPTDPGEASIMSVDAFIEKQVEHESHDTREKLEADIAHDFYLYKKPGLERIFGWLDRQAAITERHILTHPDERDELKAENKLLRERKCPGYNPDRHYCEFRAQDFKLNSKTVRTLKQDRKKLIDILTNIGVEVRDDEFGLSFMYDNYHNLGSENERLEEQLIDARKSRDHWQRVAGKHAAEIKRLKGQLEAERELAGIWPRWEDGAPIKPPCEIVYEGRRERIQGITFYEKRTVFQFTGVDHGNESVGYPHGCTFERPPLVAKDGKPIEVGQTLYGEDGKAWVVEGIDRKNTWSVWAHYENNTDRHKCLKPEWLMHEKPDTFGVCQNGGKGAAAQALQPLPKEPGDIGGTPLLELGA